jgi:hypothetical protein
MNGVVRFTQVTASDDKKIKKYSYQLLVYAYFKYSFVFFSFVV